MLKSIFHKLLRVYELLCRGVFYKFSSEKKIDSMRVCGMEKQSLSRLMLTPSHVSSLFGCQMDFCVFITKPASVSDFLTTRECTLDCTLSADPSPSSIKTDIFIP